MEKRKEELKKGLKSRYMSMIAIGGTIGAGLFFTSGSAINQAGPGGALVAYLVMGAIVYTMIIALIEMASFLPVAGTFKEYPKRFFDPAWAFANGWSYWFGCAITVTAELVACSIIIKYWFPNTSSVLWAMFFLAILLVLNPFSVNHFGEGEYWLSGIKVITIIIFLIVGLLMIFGLVQGNEFGFDNWTLDAGEAGKAPFVNGAGGVVGAFLVAGFSFSNTKLIGVSAAESENPSEDVPKSVRNVFMVIFLFYVGCIFIIGTLIPFTDPNLLNTSVDNVAASPFTIVFQAAGFKAAVSVINVVVLTALLTAGNSSLYTSSRMLFAMGQSGEGPKFFAKINKKKVPVRAIIATAIIGGFSFFTSILGDGRIYQACYSLAGITTFINWLTISICHYRFRKANIAQGKDLSALPYQAAMYPAASIFGIIMSVIVIFGSNIWVFQQETFSWFDFCTNYGTIPLFLILYGGYKKKHHTKIIPLTECDFKE